jgi:hypothetical protein
MFLEHLDYLLNLEHLNLWILVCPDELELLVFLAILVCLEHLNL